MPSTPYAKQNINKKDISNVSLTLKSEYLTTGPKIIEFEKKLSKYFGSKFCVALNSATSALHISCLALGLTKMIIFGLRQYLLLLHLIVHFTVVQK